MVTKKTEVSSIFYDFSVEKKDIYTIKINSGGLPLIMERGEVKIIFINGFFSEVIHPEFNKDSRSGWHILKAIAEYIESIEEQYKAKG